MSPTKLIKPSPLHFDRSETYILKNNGDHTITLRMPGRITKVEPGKQQFVTLDMICIYFGDPRSVVGTRRKFEDSRGTGEIADRETEVKDLKVHYGIYSDGDNALADAVPNVEFKKATGQEFFPPAIDPYGELSSGVGPRDISDMNSMSDIAAVIADHERQIAALRQLRNDRDVPDEEETELTVDLGTLEDAGIQ